MSNSKSALVPLDATKIRDSRLSRRGSSLLEKDEEIVAASNRLDQIRKEEYKLKTKIEKRSAAIFKQQLFELVKLDKWQLNNVDLYQRTDHSFSLSFELLSDFEPLENGKAYLGLLRNNKSLKQRQGTTTMVAINKLNKKIKSASKATKTFRDLTYQMEIMNVSQINLGGNCIASIGYNYMTIESFGPSGKQNVFNMIKKLGMTVDYASHLKAIELAESEISLRKQLINDISAKSLFAL